MNNEETTKNMYTYYISNDDVACEPIFAPFELKIDTWPIVITAPSTSLKSPKYNWDTQSWFDNDTQATSQKIDDLADQVKDLQEHKAKTDKTDQAMQQMMTQNNVMMAQFSTQMTQVGKAINQLTQVVNAQNAQTADNTEKEGDK